MVQKSSILRSVFRMARVRGVVDTCGVDVGRKLQLERIDEVETLAEMECRLN